MNMETIRYDNRLVRAFAFATVFWGIVGMLAGVIIALQIFIPEANLGLPWTTFGRLRPLHTNAVIFAFVGNGIFTGVYYSLQRLCKTRMFSDTLGWIHFWGWQLIIVAAAITLPLGYTTGKEYAELEWPIDIAITLVWVVFAINLFGTLAKRRERHMYVAIWFYISTVVTVAVLHIFNSFELPLSWLKSYSIYAGVQDALIQWWYGHNAVAFFLTTPYLGLMYYFIPKASGRPVFSYRLSIIHFWALIFIYIWAGPHHLLYSATPDWAQSLGMVFSVMLVAPSWGGTLNGLLTLRGAWDKVRQDPVLKFLVVAVTAYGMATIEGPILSVKSVNALSHFTDWTIAHAHNGALGWNGFLTFGMLYWLIPRLYNTSLWSNKLATWHFWIGLIGMMFYLIPIYWTGVTQGLMWKQFTPDGFLQYPNFLETLLQLIPMYILRAIGGSLYLFGAILMAYNLYRTAKQGQFAPDVEVQVPAEMAPVLKEDDAHPYRHRWLERKPFWFTVLALIAILIGGIVEAVPTFVIRSNIPTISSVRPYTPLELHGRDIYIREGCVNCHSQLVRPFRSETERYGEYSKSGEYVYDHPFLWGSKRTGPDLHRIGKKYPNAWHARHMEDPRSTSPGSVMPPYPWLLKNKLDTRSTAAKIKLMRKLGVPYPPGYEYQAMADLKKQAQEISEDLKRNMVPVEPDREIIALIAYLQRLGTDIQAEREAEKKHLAGASL
ncbi:MAG: cytochrome-c oxidase, cbb3-type subunit I [Kiritimatiellae bacterium]|nr:cytochrome-c oxidase, cbb3-type subunit I [Kiritimatiellia bacterium]MDW8458324.1 cytochrome-c oxidase, cbb3-type subunit I [Verrucomicrobiota bacterium]